MQTTTPIDHEKRFEEYVLLSKPIGSMMCELRMIGQTVQYVQKSDGSLDLNPIYVWVNPKAQELYEECEQLLTYIRKSCGFE